MPTVDTDRGLAWLRERWPGLSRSIWYGSATRQWWAALPGVLLSAPTPHALDQALRRRLEGA